MSNQLLNQDGQNMEVEQGVVIKLSEQGVEIIGIGQENKENTASMILNATALVLADIHKEHRQGLLDQILEAANNLATYNSERPEDQPTEV